MMKRIIFIIAVTFCLCACEKQQSHWLNECWCGEYAATMIDNDTGERKSMSLAYHCNSPEIDQNVLLQKVLMVFLLRAE